ncbi:hypothetical protein ABZ330_17635 [Streptomyces sp. NPDC006172]
MRRAAHAGFSLSTPRRQAQAPRVTNPAGSDTATDAFTHVAGPGI